MMLAFSMVVLLMVATLWLTRPFWQHRRPSGMVRAAANVAAYNSRLLELKADIAAGVLPAEDAVSIQQEMDARLLKDAAASTPSAAAEASGGKVLALVLFVLLAAFAGLWYWQAGSWQVAQQIATAPAGGSPAGGSPDIEAMVAKLSQRLAAQPDDAEGWAMLGRSHYVMGKYGESAKGYERANTLSKSSNADWLVSEGEALAMSRDRDLLGRPAQLFEAALALQPSYGKALWYGGLADAQGGNFSRASQRLELLLAQDLPDELKTMVAERLDELHTLSGTDGSAKATQPASQPTQPAQPAKMAAAGTQLTVQVTLDPALAARVPSNVTLFVFAKAAPLNGTAPPMPLAVQRLPGAKLPITITLDDTMAMTPAMTLSQFDRYTVTARLSQSGGALPTSGDLEGSLTVSRSEANRPLSININQARP